MNEVILRKTGAFLLLAALIMLESGCQQRESALIEPDTTTISPATPPQSDDSETVATQTTEVGEERSPNEGGVLTDPSASPAPSAAPTASPTRPAPPSR